MTKIGASVEQMPRQHKKVATADANTSFFHILSFAGVLSNALTYTQNKKTSVRIARMEH